MRNIFVLALLLVFGLAGCASTPTSRIKESPSVYTSLPPDQQALVKNGEVGLGMSEQAVELALGKPDQITESTNAKEQILVWHYMDRVSGNASISYAEVFASPHFGFFPEVIVSSPQIPVDRVRVAFNKGQVVAIDRAIVK